jgi:hypothetical protein
MTEFYKNEPDNDSFQEKYRKKHPCPPEKFEQQVLWQCMHTPSRPLAWLIWLIHQEYFQPDLDLIGELKNTNRFSQVRDIIGFHSVPPPKANFLRQWFKIRMSKSKLLKLAKSVFRVGDAE